MSTMIHGSTTIAQATALATIRGKKLTKKRTKVMALLIEAQKPLSAYEITDIYNEIYHEHIIAMSVYRILDWLVEEHFAHRLNSVHKYVACHNEQCIRQPAFSIFIICKTCQITIENHAPEHLQRELQEQISGSQYSNISPHVELMGVCQQCIDKQKTGDSKHA
ncbi:Fur family transcriptional regulator [Aliiglaciecola sp. M165]|uniref:Fur family transcriptional regulator n=1 Tax=Aliiglaciecola sp. M165 TaxID=2593649 RepID=UPI00117C88DB|nr:transcriptional repressor [Aliiglaciecola sp. M165]TRY33747.1 transcriptional repressor [Aliiglaciecola sp. M165]